MIGDSHCLVFRDLVFERDGKHFVTRAMHCPGLDARDFVDADGNLNPMVFDSLRSEHLIRPDAENHWRSSHLTNSPIAQSAAGLAESDRSAPVISVIVGSGDLYYFVKSLTPGTDFPLQGVPFRAEEFEDAPVTSTLSWRLVIDAAAAMLGPLFRGLRLLERAGFSRIFLHSLSPQTTDDSEYQKITGMYAPSRLRYKATLLFNAMFREFVRQNPAIGLIDTWELTTANGKLNERFLLDHWHLNKEAAFLTVGALVQAGSGRSVLGQHAVDADLSRAVKEASGDNGKPAAIVESNIPLADLNERLLDLCVGLRDAKERAERELQVVQGAAEERMALLEANEAKFRQLSDARETLQKIAEERLAEIHSLTRTAEDRLSAMLAYKADAEQLRDRLK